VKFTDLERVTDDELAEIAASPQHLAADRIKARTILTRRRGRGAMWQGILVPLCVGLLGLIGRGISG
jgi:hypothetical protein